MIHFLKLIRFPNLLVVALTQYLMRFCIIYPILRMNNFDLQFSELDFFLLVMSTVLITAAGYIINDYFDTKTDLLNRPDTVIVGSRISRRVAMTLHTIFNVIGVALGVYISYKVGFIGLGSIFFITAVLLWFYSTEYKRQLLIGNIIVSILTALVPFLVALYEVPMLNKVYKEVLLGNHTNMNKILIWILGFSFFAFITTIIREIIKDIEDFEGDHAYGRNTLPIVIGINYTRLIVIILICITIAALLFVYFSFLDDPITIWYFIVALILPMLYLIFRLIRAKEKKDYTFSSLLTKIIMLAGLVYSLVVYYTISQYY